MDKQKQMMNGTTTRRRVCDAITKGVRYGRKSSWPSPTTSPLV